MNNLTDLEKKINSELTTKIKNSEIRHDQLYIGIDNEDLIDVTLFIKSNENTKFRQLIDLTIVDYPEKTQRFKVVYLFLSHEFNQRIILSCLITSIFCDKLIHYFLTNTSVFHLKGIIISIDYNVFTPGTF